MHSEEQAAPFAATRNLLFAFAAAHPCLPEAREGLALRFEGRIPKGGLELLSSASLKTTSTKALRLRRRPLSKHVTVAIGKIRG